jgi:hypothetical protein
MSAQLTASDPVWAKVAAAERFAVGAEGHDALVLPVTGAVRDVLRLCGVEPAELDSDG